MEVWELQEKTRKTEPHYFDRDTLKFFGESISSMNVLKNHYTITDYQGVKHDCVCLSKLQRKYPGGARRSYDYFDTTTWERIFPNN
jgi:hypothetical protein